MKNNTQETKLLLQKALANTPQDNALTEVRYFIRSALSKLENVERKREKREIVAEKRAIAINNLNSNQYDAFHALRAIDEEINKERIKIEQIRQKRIMPDEKDDNDEFQTVLG